MKRNLKINHVWLLILIVTFFSACSKKSVDPDGGDTPGLKGADLAATLNFENNGKVDIKYKFPGSFMFMQPTLIQPKNPKGDEGSLSIFVFDESKAGEYEITIAAVINGKGKYNWTNDYDEDGDENGALISVNYYSENDGDNRSYYPFLFTGSKTGTTTLEITSISKNKIKGTFSGTLYELSSGEKLTISGQFDSALTKITED